MYEKGKGLGKGEGTNVRREEYEEGRGISMSRIR